MKRVYCLCLSLWLVQASALAEPSSWWKSKRAWACASVLVATTALGTVWLWHTSSPQEPARLTLNEPHDRGLVLERQELSRRLSAFDGLLADEQRVVLSLKDDAGLSPSATLLTKNFVQRIVAERIKQKLREANPALDLAAEPGIRVTLTSLILAEDPTDPRRVYVGFDGPLATISSLQSVAKSELFSGRTLVVEMEPHHVKDEKGEATVEAKVALRYNPRQDWVEIVEGKGSIRVFAPHQVNEQDIASFPVSRSAVLGLFPAR